MASGGTFKEISKTNFSNLEIPLPPLDVQNRIVAELDRYRQEVVECRQRIDELNSQLNGRLAEVWEE